jgi:hypothetical protein
MNSFSNDSVFDADNFDYAPKSINPKKRGSLMLGWNTVKQSSELVIEDDETNRNYDSVYSKLFGKFNQGCKTPQNRAAVFGSSSSGSNNHLINGEVCFSIDGGSAMGDISYIPRKKGLLLE